MLLNLSLLLFEDITTNHTHWVLLESDSEIECQIAGNDLLVGFANASLAKD